jgi:hypothetical protein
MAIPHSIAYPAYGITLSHPSAASRSRLFADEADVVLSPQLVGTRQLRRYAHNYRYWRPAARRPYVAWPLVGQIAATVGLTVLEQAGMAMWGLLRDILFGQLGWWRLCSSSAYLPR